MNRTRAMSLVNPQAQSLESAGGADIARGASHEEALGFVGSCPGVSHLAHYCLIPSDDTTSRRECAAWVKRELKLKHDLDVVEACVEVFVNRHEASKQAAINLISGEIYDLLCRWEAEWMRKVGECDKEYC